MSFCVRLGPDVPAERIGGKARSLVRLAAAGLPVPPAIVVTSDLYQALRSGGPPLPATLAAPDALAEIDEAARALGSAPWPEGFAETLAREVDTLGPEPGCRFAVRSSAALEDQAGALAPGLFLSRVDVARGEVLAAVREVMGSALSPAVIAYLTERGLPPASLRFAVLIHGYSEGDVTGVAAWDPASREPIAVEVRGDNPEAARGVPRPKLDQTIRALASVMGAVEVEWVSAKGELTFLQVRPYQRGPLRRTVGPARPSEPARDRGHPAPTPPPDLTADWHWDAAHNPLPLSPAQAGLVELVDRRCRIGIRQRVVGGYLFYVLDPRSSTAPMEPEVALRAVSELAAERLAQPTPTLEEALETFLAVYRPLFGVVQPNARAKREMLGAFLRRCGFDPSPLLPKLLAGVSSAATERARRARALASAATPQEWKAALAEYLVAFGDEAPRWDVAAPTWRETPAALERLVRGANIGPPIDPNAWREAADAVSARLSPDARPEWEERLAAARAAAAVAEDDDVLYARIQAFIRRVLLREGARLVARGVLASTDEIFWLSLETIRRDARGDITLAYEDAAPLIVAAQRTDAEARSNPPPLGAAESEQPIAGTGVVRGRSGAGGARIGRVRIYGGHTGHDQTQDQILVARTLLPTELPLLAPAAIVVETGGILDHVAAQARERGIPAVVGASGATALLRNGDQVLVDGNAGLVVRLG
jgi:pyruvate,water dikinase